MIGSARFCCIVSVISLCTLDTANSTAQDALSPPNMISRAAWGAKPPAGPYNRQDIQRITIHHQGVVAGAHQDSSRRLRIMQAFHQSKERGFTDISYHFIIDRNGNLYEGRPLWAAGETKTDYDPKGHLLICLLGDFNVQEPSDKQKSTLSSLIRWCLKTFHLPADSVKGHRDYAHTDCPGKNVYHLIQEGVISK